MYAIAFDMEVSKLKENYGIPYNPAYLEIKRIMKELGFEWRQGSLYISEDEKNTLTHVYKAIAKLSKVDWFKNSVRDIRVFKIEDWSDFTSIIKD